MRVYVITETPALYADWCARHRVNPAAAVHVSDPRELRGRLEKADRVIDAREKVVERHDAMYA
jgi:hypothetical protein